MLFLYIQVYSGVFGARKGIRPEQTDATISVYSWMVRRVIEAVITGSEEKRLITVFTKRNRPKQGADGAEPERREAATMRRWRAGAEL